MAPVLAYGEDVALIGVGFVRDNGLRVWTVLVVTGIVAVIV
jgi:hypothetical protein